MQSKLIEPAQHWLRYYKKGHRILKGLLKKYKSSLKELQKKDFV